MSHADSFRFPARRWLLVAAGACGLLGLLLEHGTSVVVRHRVFVEALSWAAVGLFLLETLLAAFTGGSWRRFLRRRWPALALAGLFAGEVLAARAGLLDFLSLRLTRLYVILAQFYVLGNLLVNLPHLNPHTAYRRVRPGILFVCAFVFLIVIGSGLLMLPGAVVESPACGFGDAIFTSTSAVCVTGLIVRDTATEFSTFGQFIILLLIQLGGLGIMSLTATLSLLVGRGIGLRESNLLREVFQVPMLGEVGKTLRFIVVMTFTCEAIGAGLLYVGLSDLVPDQRERLFTAVFHSISAFCNAGFSTFSDSLVGLQNNDLVVGVIAALLVIGGIGFAVVANILAYLWGRLLRRRAEGRRRRARLELNTRLVLGLSALLLTVGVVLILLLEWQGALAGLPWHRKLAQAFFQSATTRTAGFNTLDLTLLKDPTLFMMVVLMFIGAAPGSTAGGVKVTVIALIWANLHAIGRGWKQPRLLGREVDVTTVHRALLVLSAGLVMAACGTFLLLVSEGAGLRTTVFEVFSALGTVGLSLGLTPELTGVGRLVIIVLMFVGRLGPLTMAYGLVRPSRERNVRLPRARIMVG